MIKEALQYLIETVSGPKTVDVGGRPYSDQTLHAVKHPVVEPISVSTLSALAQYLMEGPDPLPEKVLVNVKSPTEVVAVSPLFGEFKQRDAFVTAKASLPHLVLGAPLASEDFQIMLRTAFAGAGDRDILLKLVGNVVDEAAVTVVDDGISQEATIKSGVASRAKVTLPNPVKLAPYRTFLDVQQVMSPFLFRMHKGPTFSLHEADGGAWRMETTARVKDWLVKALLPSDRIIVLA